METCLEEYRTNKYYCKKCNNNDMFPNKEGDYIKGFRCQICGEVNYPTNNTIGKDENLSKQMFWELKRLRCKTCDNFNACFIDFNFKPCEKAQHWQWHGFSQYNQGGK